MKDIEELKKIKEKFDMGLIQQDDMDVETQYAIAELYKQEIEEIRDRISKSRDERAIYLDMIDYVDEAQKLLDNFNE